MPIAIIMVEGNIRPWHTYRHCYSWSELYAELEELEKAFRAGRIGYAWVPIVRYYN
jgi:hypothetical protein